jgi:two-component system response regulator HydG
VPWSLVIEEVDVPALVFSLGSGGEVRYPLPVGRTVLGRADTCDVALPDEDISRVHCVIDRTPDQTLLIDRSRNGTLVDGQIVERHVLTHDSVIEIGSLRLRFVNAPGGTLIQTLSSVRPLPHEELVAADSLGVASSKAVLRFTRGPRTGDELVLERSVLRLGGGPADVSLLSLPAGALTLRVARGRVVIDPTPEVRVSLAGLPVVVATPALPGEEVVVGPHAFLVEQRVDHEEPDAEPFGDLVGTSAVMRRLFGVLKRIAAHDYSVLVVGESGTGKELAARAIHDQGARSSGPFVPINCAALPENLVESTLFGHEKGAFTGATQRQDGAFHRAHGGTLFLDEVGELRLDTQAKLLRALESGEVLRVGAARTETPDVRIVAATNRDLPAMVKQGLFRSDLYFRLSVLTVGMPPLRERPEDIPSIAKALVERTLPDASLDSSAYPALQRHSWPGNVRELRNVLTRARVLGGAMITAGTLRFSTEGHAISGEPIAASQVTDEALREALERAGGNRSQAARALGIPRSSLLYRLKRMSVEDSGPAPPRVSHALVARIPR